MSRPRGTEGGPEIPSEPIEHALAEVLAWDEAYADVLERAWRDAYESLPVPVFPGGASELADRRAEVEAFVAAAEARRGQPARLLALARARFVRSGAAGAYLALLARFGEREHAIELALSILDDADGQAAGSIASPSRQDVRAFLAELLELPPGFEAALDALALAPTLEGWQSLSRFSSPEHRAHRMRYAAIRLTSLGVGGDAVFALVATEGKGSYADSLAERGFVSPTRIVAFASELARGDRARLFGLAFRSAVVRGEAFLAVRMLRACREAGRDAESMADDRAFAFAHGTSAVKSALGFGRAEGPPVTEPSA